MMNSATEATTHDALLSTDDKGDGNIQKEPGWPSLLQAAHHLTTHVGARLPGVLHCAKMRQARPG
jgi:hypothetical protein